MLTNVSPNMVHFAVMAIGATAKEMNVSPTALYNRLEKWDLIQQLLFNCYDTLHVESLKGVVWNIQEALRNREARDN